MTPAEQAHLIDKQEFEAECQAIRQRAFQLIMQRHAADRSHRARFPNVYPAPRSSLSSSYKNGFSLKGKTLLDAQGQTRTLKDWATVIGVSTSCLRSRLAHGKTLEEAIAMGTHPPRSRRHTPGVSSDFTPSEGTGGGSTAQETPEITFSEKAENA